MTEINYSSLKLLAPGVVMAVIFWFSAQPYDGGPMPWWEEIGRNLGHFLGYALLASTWIWAIGRRSPSYLALAAGLSLAYAAADEYHQTFVAGRTGTWEDVVLDGLGIAAACLYARWRTLSARRTREA